MNASAEQIIIVASRSIAKDDGNLYVGRVRDEGVIARGALHSVRDTTTRGEQQGLRAEGLEISLITVCLANYVCASEGRLCILRKTRGFEQPDGRVARVTVQAAKCVCVFAIYLL